MKKIWLIAYSLILASTYAWGQLSYNLTLTESMTMPVRMGSLLTNTFEINGQKELIYNPECEWTESLFYGTYFDIHPNEGSYFSGYTVTFHFPPQADGVKIKVFHPGVHSTTDYWISGYTVKTAEEVSVVCAFFSTYAQFYPGKTMGFIVGVEINESVPDGTPIPLNLIKITTQGWPSDAQHLCSTEIIARSFPARLIWRNNRLIYDSLKAQELVSCPTVESVDEKSVTLRWPFSFSLSRLETVQDNSVDSLPWAWSQVTMFESIKQVYDELNQRAYVEAIIPCSANRALFRLIYLK